MDKGVIFNKLRELLVSEFKVDADSISFDKRLEEDFELDSLDMVDLLMDLSDYVEGTTNPGMFKDACTIEDIVNLLVPIWKKT